jgi:protein O-GlcNAc transferase
MPNESAPRDLLARAEKLHRAGSLNEAETCYRTVLQHEPRSLRAHRGLGQLLALMSRHAEAERHYLQVVRLQPREAAAHVELAQTLRSLGRGEDAAHCFERAAALAPDNAHYRLLVLLNQGTVLDGQGRTDEAVAMFERAAREFPQAADAWAALGFVQAHLRGPAEAAVSLAKALQLDPKRRDVQERLAEVLQDDRRYEDAAILFEQLMKDEPQRPLVPGRLLHNKMLMADWVSLGPLVQRVETQLLEGRLSTEPFGLQGYCTSPEILRQGARLYAAERFPDRREMLGPQRPSADIARADPLHRIRLAYLAGEFRNQATSVLLTEVLELHDRRRFEVICLDNGWDDGSSLRRRIEACCEVVPIRGTPNLPAAQMIRERGVDILVNLNGFFGLARSPIFAFRPAPIQVNYLGFPGTLGMPYIDYLIADPTVVPEIERRWYDEQIVYLPDCYQPNDRQRALAAEPATRAEIGLPEGAFVFCCMNNIYKIVPSVFDVWTRVLLRVPGSVLLLYSEDEVARVNLRHEARVRGVDPARLHFGGPLRNENHLRRLQLCDLFLDSWPYNAHTTGSDALWAGLPVLTLTGRTFPSRVGASLLKAAGLPELVTDDLRGYEELAVRLATEPGLLAGLRRRLAAERDRCPLYDTPRYTRHLEQAYETMVERARAGLAPQGFACAALPPTPLVSPAGR